MPCSGHLEKGRNMMRYADPMIHNVALTTVGIDLNLSLHLIRNNIVQAFFMVFVWCLFDTCLIITESLSTTRLKTLTVRHCSFFQSFYFMFLPVAHYLTLLDNKKEQQINKNCITTNYTNNQTRTENYGHKSNINHPPPYWTYYNNCISIIVLIKSLWQSASIDDSVLNRSTTMSICAIFMAIPPTVVELNLNVIAVLNQKSR